MHFYNTHPPHRLTSCSRHPCRKSSGKGGQLHAGSQWSGRQAKKKNYALSVAFFFACRVVCLIWACGENATASYMRQTPSFLFLAAAVRCYGCGRHVAKMPRPCLVFCGNLIQGRFADYFCPAAAKHRSQTGGHPPSFAPTITAAASQPPAQT